MLSQPISEVFEPVQNEIVDEEPLVEKFNSNTIHQFKKNLGSLGDIYINDAPLASLTNSNTVSEIKCSKKVMGMKMTEELRNIAQFFLKDYTLDVDPTIYNIQHNANKVYLTHKSAAIIGGISTSKTDILERILLANSFLDTFE